MLNIDEVSFGPSVKRPDGMVLAFAIDSEVVHIMFTHREFYELITSGYAAIEDETVPENTYRVIFKNGEEVVETLECDELLSAILRSEPKVIVLVAEPRPPIEELGISRYVNVGWTVDEDNNFIPPADWVHPNNRPAVTEEQKEKARELGYKVD